VLLATAAISIIIMIVFIGWITWLTAVARQANDVFGDVHTIFVGGEEQMNEGGWLDSFKVEQAIERLIDRFIQNATTSH
jgi:hypothetical protein